MLIKNSSILSKDFLESFANLMAKKMPAKQCLEVSSSVEELIAQHQIVLRARKAIADKYCQKNEEGVPLSDENGELIFETPEIKEICKKELQEILDEEIDISLSNRIRISGNEPMTPLQIRLLKDVIEVVD